MTKIKMNCPLCGGASEDIWREKQYTAYVCGRCAAIFVRPLPVRPASLYDARYFENWYVPFYDRRAAFLRELFRGLPDMPAKKGRLLDVGCGIGIFLDIARSDNWEVYGQDVSPFAVSYCRKKDFTVFDKPLDEIGGRDGTFDLVTLWDVLAHLPDPAAYLRAASRLLKPGGMLVIKTPDHPRRLFRCARVFSFTGRSRTLLHIPAQIFHFTPASLRNLLLMSNLEPVGLKGLKEMSNLGSLAGVLHAVTAADRSFVIISRNKV